MSSSSADNRPDNEIDDTIFKARVVTRGHSLPQYGWSDVTILYVDVTKAPNGRGIVGDGKQGFDVTASMQDLLAEAAGKQGLTYAPAPHKAIYLQPVGKVRGVTLPKATITRDGDTYEAHLPDGRVEDVSPDVSRILTERIGFLVNKFPHKSGVGTILPTTEVGFSLPPHTHSPALVDDGRVDAQGVETGPAGTGNSL